MELLVTGIDTASTPVIITLINEVGEVWEGTRTSDHPTAISVGFRVNQGTNVTALFRSLGFDSCVCVGQLPHEAARLVWDNITGVNPSC
jgi:hypothetical protein